MSDIQNIANSYPKFRSFKDNILTHPHTFLQVVSTAFCTLRLPLALIFIFIFSLVRIFILARHLIARALFIYLAAIQFFASCFGSDSFVSSAAFCIPLRLAVVLLSSAPLFELKRERECRCETQRCDAKLLPKAGSFCSPPRSLARSAALFGERSRLTLALQERANLLHLRRILLGNLMMLLRCCCCSGCHCCCSAWVK